MTNAKTIAAAEETFQALAGRYQSNQSATNQDCVFSIAFDAAKAAFALVELTEGKQRHRWMHNALMYTRAATTHLELA